MEIQKSTSGPLRERFEKDIKRSMVDLVKSTRSNFKRY